MCLHGDVLVGKNKSWLRFSQQTGEGLHNAGAVHGSDRSVPTVGVSVGLLATVLGPLLAPRLVVLCRRWAPSRVVKRHGGTVVFLASSRCDGLERGAAGSGCASSRVWRCVVPNFVLRGEVFAQERCME